MVAQVFFNEVIGLGDIAISAADGAENAFAMMHIADGAAQERAKYEEIWSIPEYKDVSPGLQNVERFMEVMKPEAGSTLIDIGCGAGVAGLEFDRLGLGVWWTDITDAGLDGRVPREQFIKRPLWASRVHWVGQWAYGFCCDVLEHIPPEYTMLCIDRCLADCVTVWFQIANTPDAFGQIIGQPLHLTVRPYDWWLIRMATLGKVIDARDLCGSSLFVVTR